MCPQKAEHISTYKIFDFDFRNYFSIFIHSTHGYAKGGMYQMTSSIKSVSNFPFHFIDLDYQKNILTYHGGVK